MPPHSSRPDDAADNHGRDLGHDRDFGGVREEYRRASLDVGDVDAHPLRQLAAWIDDALAAGLADASAMVLATTDAQGCPRARTVLCKGLTATAVEFYTNLASQKGRDLAAHPCAAAVFLWTSLERQVTLRGAVAPVPEAEADAYFAARPRGSQLGAWASRQSEPVPDRAALDAALAEAQVRFAGAAVPRPPFWGGFALTPSEVEVWQGRPDRLHDRLRYTRRTDGWALQRLSP